MSTDISRLTPKELQDLTAAAQARLNEISAEHRTATRNELTEYAKSAGYDIYELFGFSPKARPAKVRGGSRSKPGSPSKTGLEPKYSDPSTGATWVGRGKRPRWVSDYVSGGGNIDDLLINKVA